MSRLTSALVAVAPFALSASLVSLSACSTSSEPDPTGPEIAITVSPLSLPEITNASYRITVRTPTDVVWTADIDADTYGNGEGAVTYVGPCDATAVNTVELTLLDLFDAGGRLDASDYVNPTINGPLTRTVPCIPNADQLVEFNLTVMRSAQQGFFDIAVNFEDLFCSAKLDCRDGQNPIELVHHPVSGERLPSAVIALACTAGPRADTHLYMTELVVTCGETIIGIPVTQGPGNLYSAEDPAPRPLTQVMTFTGKELLSQDNNPLNKLYFNTAIGIDFSAIGPNQLAQGCTLSLRATAADGALEDCSTAADTTYPILALDAVPFIAPRGQGFACTNHPLGSASFPVRYTNGTPQTFDTEVYATPIGTVSVDACEPVVAPDTVDVSGRVYEDLDGDGAYTPGEERSGVQLELMIDATPGANLDFVPLPRVATSNTTGHYLLADIPVRTPLCWRRVNWPTTLGAVQCGLTLTPTVGGLVLADLAVRSSCVPVAANDTTCDGIDDDCDGIIDEDSNPLACDPCLANSDCCSGLCDMNVCVGPALPYVVTGNLTVMNPATLPLDYECITEVTGNLQLSPNPLDGNLPPLNFASLELVGGSFTLVATSAMTSAHFPLLTDIGAFTHFGAEPLLLSVPALTTVGNTFNVYGDGLMASFTSLATLSFPLYIAPSAPASALTLDFPALTTATELYFYGATATSSLTFPALTTLSGTLVAGYNDTDPDALSFPVLSTIGGDLQVAGANSTSPPSSLWPDLSVFASVTGVDRLIVRNHSNLTSLGLTGLQTVVSSVIIRWNTALDCAVAQALVDQLTSTPENVSINGNLAGCSSP